MGDFGFPQGGESRFFPFFRSSGCPETQFLPISARRDAPKHSFCCFPLVGVPRNAVFTVFRSSGLPETQFLPISTRRGVPKRSFCQFLLVGVSRNAVFHRAAAMKDNVACGSSLWNAQEVPPPKNRTTPYSSDDAGGSRPARFLYQYGYKSRSC